MILPFKEKKEEAQVKIDTFVIGDDWKGKFDFLKDEGVEVIYLPRTPEISTKHAVFESNPVNQNIVKVKPCKAKSISKKLESANTRQKVHGQVTRSSPATNS